MNKIIVLFGKPGAGKGTRLSEFLNGKENEYEVLGVSNLLRKARKDQTELGKKAAVYMDAGELVPDDIINAIVIEGIKAAKRTVFLDGFPRTVGQAEAMIATGVYPDKVINFHVPDDVVVQRAKDRIVCQQCGESYTLNSYKRPKTDGVCDKCGGSLSRRKDDDEDIVKHRLKVYQEETHPALDILAKATNKIFTIDNTCPDAGEAFVEILSI